MKALCMKEDDARYCLALKFIPDVGNVACKNLIDAFGSPVNVFRASHAELSRVYPITERTARRIREFSDWSRVDRELSLADRQGVAIITAQDNVYPKNLRTIYDYPPLLYVRGSLSPDEIFLAVVGSRLASTYGKFITERLCRELALQGITIVSGMARGIDSAAHRGALAGKGRTIAVLGSGIDVIYPPENRKLYERIAAQGAVITELPFATEPAGPHFPARNRIISGMSLGVVVAEATERSGSLITARCALDQGREVFAIPGSIDSPGSRGTHALIREGAKLCEDISDIVEEILPQIDVAPSMKEGRASEAGTAGDPLTAPETTLLDKIGSTPLHVDRLIAMTGLKTGDLLNILLTLELKGYIEQLPGKLFIRKE